MAAGNIVTVANGGASAVTRAATSTNDTAWTLENMPTNANGTGSSWQDIAYSPTLHRFCAINQSANTNNNNGWATSDDGGVTWTGRGNTGANAPNAICWAAGLSLFVMVGDAGLVATSPDGVTFTNRTAAEANQWEGVDWAPALGLLCAISNGGTHQIMTSPDGTNWTARTGALDSTSSTVDVCWDRTAAVFMGVSHTQGGKNQTSPDGINWTQHTVTGQSFGFDRICSDGAGHFLAAGGNSGQVMYYATLTSGTQTSSVIGAGAGNKGCCWDTINSLWVVVGNNGLATAPAAGTVWTTQTITAEAWNQVVSGVPAFTATQAQMVF